MNVAVGSVIDRIAALDAQIAALEAESELAYAQLGELTSDAILALPKQQQARELPLRDVAARIGARLRVSDRTARHRIGEAQSLVTQFPATVAAWGAGEISRGHVRVIADAGVRIVDVEARALFEQQVLQVARDESVARTRPVADRLVERFDPRSPADRHAVARADRRVRVYARPDGMSRVVADLPAILGRGIAGRLTQLAEQQLLAFDGTVLRELLERASALEGAAAGRARLCVSVEVAVRVDVAWANPDADEADDGAGVALPETETEREPRRAAAVQDDRTMDQRRADLLAELLLTGVPSGADPDACAAITAQVQLTVPVLTLLGDDDQPGAAPAELAGHGPIDPATARRLTATAPGWDRVLTHPVTGMVLAVDRYRPTEQQRRYLRARDVHCRFPGCTVPVRRCDIDHTIEYARGGPTDTRYLAHECEPHHDVRHHSAWTVIPRADGVFEWIDPDGRHYRDRPPSTIGFLPDYGRIQQSRDGLRLIADPEPPPF